MDDFGYTKESNFENIANAIRSKNGTDNTYAPSEMASAIEELKVGELDFSNVYDQEQANELNQYYKDAIAYAQEIKRNWDENNDKCIFNDKNIVYFPNINVGNCNTLKFNGCTNLVYMPKNMDFSNVVIFHQGWHECTNLEYAPEILDIPNAKNISRILNSCKKLKKLPIILNSNNVTNFEFSFSNLLLRGDLSLNTNSATSLYGIAYASLFDNIYLTSIDNVTNLTYPFRNCTNLTELRLSKWKTKNLEILQSSLLSVESVDNILENAVDKVDGATDRTLQLHATAGANWDANSKYQGEERNLILTQKGIEVTW